MDSQALTKKIRIVLADNHQILREGLKALVNSQENMEVIGEADNGRSAVALARQLRPDIVVMDVSMPELNGLKATQHLKESCPEINVIALTRHSDPGFLQQLLKAGAAGYILKQSNSSELIRAIQAVAAGMSYLDPSITRNIVDEYVGRRTNVAAIADHALTPREEEVLRLTAFGYSNKEIANQLDISVKTVEAHKANAMTKLGMKGRIDIVRYALLRDWLKDY